MRRLLIAGLALTPLVLCAPPAHAEVRQTAPCAIADAAPGLDLRVVPPSQSAIGFQQLWQFTQGEGQKVAVIDTGVTPNPRLRHVSPGGDLVNGGDGLDDCDAHGTLVAGIIAAAPDPGDGFSGIAPGVEILSIRQSSGKFTEYAAAAPGVEPESEGAGSIRTLAEAIRMATAAGATVINISEVACAPGPDSMRSDLLASAIDDAIAHDIVIVAAAGNTQGTEGSACQPNPTRIDPLDPLSRGADSVVSDVAPAHYAGKVLTVGAVEHDGSPSAFSIAGPWVSVAAPGNELVSLANNRGGGLAVQVRTERGVGAVSGTSFAAPYVAGLAALIRARHPELSARQVIERITTTAIPAAHGWDPVVGNGIVDPVAALSANLPAGAEVPGAASAPLVAPTALEPAAPGPSRRAFTGVAVFAVLLLLGGTTTAVLRRARR